MKRTLTNRILMRKLGTQLMAYMGLAMLCTVVALAQDPGAPQPQGQPTAAQQGPRTDGQIEMDVVHALDASAALKNDLITAATIQGEVTLSGTVSTNASKQLAESIASHVDGVTKVHNNLADWQPGPRWTKPAAGPIRGRNAGSRPVAGAAANGELAASGTGARRESAKPGPGPGCSQQSAASGLSAAAGLPAARWLSSTRWLSAAGRLSAASACAAAVSESTELAIPAVSSAPQYQPARGPVTIPQGMLLQVRTSEPVDSKRARDGQPVQFTVIQDVAVGGVLAIPRGATVHGVVTEAKNAGSGTLAGSSILALTLTSLDLGGQSYPLTTNEFRVKGPNKAGETVNNAVGGAIIGAIIGCAIGRGPGCAIGAGAGAAGGTAASAASGGPRVWIPAEALVTFHIAAPLTVNPVSPQEAARLAEGLYPGGPSLYRRGPYGYGPHYGYYSGYVYPYPPVYYRPYYLVGGVYYWR